MSAVRVRRPVSTFRDLLLFAENVWRALHCERQHLLARALRLEAALHRAECERDDWIQIARALARKFEGMD